MMFNKKIIFKIGKNKNCIYIIHFFKYCLALKHLVTLLELYYNPVYISIVYYLCKKLTPSVCLYYY